MKDYLSTKQAAESLGVSRTKVLSLIYQRRIVPQRIGRTYAIPQSEVDRVRASITRVAA